MKIEATGDGVELQEASGQRSASFRLRAAMGKVERVRPMLYLSLWAGILGLLLNVFGLRSGAGYGSAEAARLATLVGLMSLVLLAIQFVDRYPVPATLLLALLHTLDLGFITHSGVAWSDPESGVRAVFWTVYFWVTVYYAVKLARLAKANPESFTSKFMRSEDGADLGTHSARALQEHQALRRKERMWLIGCTALLIALTLIGVVRLGA